jgi:hypothetical protein
MIGTTVFDKDVPNYFGQLLAVLNDEELIRVKRRFELRHNRRMAEVIGDEIEERQMILEEDAKRKTRIRDSGNR